MAITSCYLFFSPPLSNHLYLSVQFYTVSRAIGSILKPWHLAWGKKNITDTVCPTRVQAQQVINTWKLFWCPGSALTLQFPAIHFRAYHSVDLYTGVICPVLCVHLFSLFVSPHAVFFLTGSGSESCFARPLSNNPSSAVLGMEGCSLNLFSQKTHHKTCLISSYLVCSLQTESIYRPRLLLTLLSALDYSSLPPLSKIKC